MSVSIDWLSPDNNQLIIPNQTRPAITTCKTREMQSTVDHTKIYYPKQTLTNDA